MKLKRRSLKIIFYFIVSLYANLFFGQNNNISKEFLIEDLIQLKKSLRTFHPALKHEEGSRIISKRILDIQSNLKDSISRLNSYKAVYSILSTLNCGHTVAYLKRAHRKHTEYHFPIELTNYKDDIFIKKDFIYKDNIITKGTAITHFNNTPIDSIINNLNFITVGHDFPNKHIQKSLTIENFKYNYSLIFGNQKQSTITVIRNNVNQNKTIKIDHIPNNIQSKSENKKQITLTIEKNTGIGIIKINSFNDLSFLNQTFKKGLKNSFKELKANRINNLIIDIRNNTGGEYYLMKKLYSYLINKKATINFEANVKKEAIDHLSFSHKLNLAKFKKEKNGNLLNILKLTKEVKPKKRYQFNGEIAVLINHGTFSAASIFGSIIKSQKRGTLIGTESGGGYQSTYGGFFKYIELNNSKFIIQIPLVEFILQENNININNRTNLKPDINIKSDFNNFMNNIDIQMIKAKETLTNKTK